MLQRLIITYAILTVGFTGISFGMMANGSAYPENPAWPFVTATRNIFVGFGVVFAAGAGLLWLIDGAAEKDWRKPIVPVEEKPPKEVTVVSREADRMAEVEREEARVAREGEKRKRAEQVAREKEESKRRQDELKRQAEEKRKNRSAEDAARSGLDDFL